MRRAQLRISMACQTNESIWTESIATDDNGSHKATVKLQDGFLTLPLDRLKAQLKCGSNECFSLTERTCVRRQLISQRARAARQDTTRSRAARVRARRGADQVRRRVRHIQNSAATSAAETTSSAERSDTSVQSRALAGFAAILSESRNSCVVRSAPRLARMSL